jgi:hypothetical protein
MNILVAGLIYTFVCFLVAARAKEKGWDFWDTFMVGFLFCPLFVVFKIFRKPI